jgi:hypothetical protein
LRRYAEAVEKLTLKRKAVVREFDGMVDDGNQFREPLLKIFLKVGTAFRHRPPRPHRAHIGPSFLELIDIL